MLVQFTTDFTRVKMDARLQHPFTCVISGPTGSGKSVWVKQLITHLGEKVTPVPKHVMWCYGEWQTLYETMPEVNFVEGMPTEVPQDTLLIIDDLMGEQDEKVTAWFTKKSHHHQTSVVYIVQNLFHKKLRTVSLNTQYMVLFKNPRDKSQLKHLAHQMGERHVLEEAFADATKQPHGYLLIDLKQATPDHLRLRANFFEEVQYVYMKK